ncbi:type I restriction endonuclease subunit R [Methanocalculus natronophilus]|uniref:type I restriction endonuclease subunit R n=2 Tax=Methanocalculus TaxID=71151 RepID=UPI0031B5F5F1
MTPAGYTEDELVEKPAIEVFRELGWEAINAYDEFDHGVSTLGRETKSEVILKRNLRDALLRLNPDAPLEAIHEAIADLTRDRSLMSMAAANQEIYHLLKNGVRVPVPDPDGDGETIEHLRIIDWEKSRNNDFLLCSQFWVTGEMHTRRADLVGFVNGIPLLLIELKAAHRRLETGFSGNIRDYKDTIPQLFRPNAMIIVSNGSQSRVGSVTAGWEHFAEWKKVGSEREPGRVSLETMLHGICAPDRLLDIVENFTLFQEIPGGLIKLVAKNHQYLGVNNAIDALTDIREHDGKLGVFWHTQGSGKSISMIFFSQKVLRTIPGNWTFVIITDRQELDNQIYKNFVSAGVVTERRAKADSSRHLRQLLTEDHRYVFSLIHKFRTEKGESHPVLSERDDIIVITDEAHRSQYDTLALNMRTALPNASFLAFTGTPLIITEEKTRQVFGEYVSVYDFKQSVDDGATVPLYYENRIPQLQLTNENLNADMAELLEAAELDEGQEKKLEREFAREYHLITRDDRLEAIARDIVDHFTGRGFRGKAMVISIDKATAIRMYEKVRSYWDTRINELVAESNKAVPEDRKEILETIAWMRETDMAVVVSQGQNEISEMSEKGLDIRPHRKRMVEEDLEKRFKQADDPFRLVFVCAMWITGFDVPSCSTLYLDKPMKNHSLMQTIARANRVYPGKVSGLIVDYVGVFRNLEKALAIYGAGGEGDNPVEDKSSLIVALQTAISETRSLCMEHGVDIDAIQAAEGFERIALKDQAVEALLVSEEVKRRFLDWASTVWRLYKAILPDPDSRRFSTQVQPIRFIADAIRSLIMPVDISNVMEQVENLLDRSIATDGYYIRDNDQESDQDLFIDLSKIDFEQLGGIFKQGKKRTINERLKGKVAQKMMKMIRLNRTRMNYLEQFQKMIEEYNSGRLSDEELFHQLVAFTKSLNEEEQRTVSEQLDEEELAIFDLLTKPTIELSASDRKRVKATSKKLLTTLKEEKLVLDWRKRQQTLSDVRRTIEQMLDECLPDIYTTELYEEKTVAVFQHVYDAYYGAGQSVYAAG